VSFFSDSFFFFLAVALKRHTLTKLSADILFLMYPSSCHVLP
jgi:hypothetical protein